MEQREPSETGMIDDMQSTTCTAPVAIIADEVTDKDKGKVLGWHPCRNNDTNSSTKRKQVMIDPKSIKAEPIDDGYETVSIGVSDVETESFTSEQNIQDLSSRGPSTPSKYDPEDLQKIALDADKFVRHGGAMAFREIMEINKITDKINNLEKVSKDLKEQSKRINTKLKKLQENQNVSKTAEKDPIVSAPSLIDLRDSIPASISVCPNVNISHGIPPQEFAQIRQRLERMRSPSPQPLYPRFIPRIMPRFVAPLQYAPMQNQTGGLRWHHVTPNERVPFVSTVASGGTQMINVPEITQSQHSTTVSTTNIPTVTTRLNPNFRFPVPQIATVQANGVMYAVPPGQYYVRNPNPPPPYPSSPRKRRRNQHTAMNGHSIALQTQQQQHQQTIDQQQQTILHQLLSAGSRPQLHPQEHLPSGAQLHVNNNIQQQQQQQQQSQDRYVLQNSPNPNEGNQGHMRPVIVAGKEVQVIPNPSPLRPLYSDSVSIQQSISSAGSHVYS